MNSVADFKRELKIGRKLACIHHMDFAGRDAEMKVIYKDKELPVREVSIVQSNAFALKTQQGDKIVNSYCGMPKAKETTFKDGKMTILETDSRQFKGGYAHESNPEYASLPMIPVLTYWFVD
jgi:hypothetical protein